MQAVLTLYHRLVDLGPTIDIIRFCGQQFLQDVCSTIGLESPDFHLAESLPAKPRLSTQWLLSDEGVGTCRACMNLVIDQVMQFQQVHPTNGNLLFHRLSGATVVKLNLAAAWHLGQQFALAGRLVELGTHAETAFIAKPITTSEQAAIPALLKQIPHDALLLWDRGYFSYELWKLLVSREIKVLARVGNHLILKPIRQLADGSYLAKIYPKSYDREKDRNGIIVRVIRYKLDDPQRVGHDEEHVLITNLLDEQLYPAEELIALYHERWEHELVFDEQKTHQDPRRASKPANLRSETPAGVIQELYAMSLAHFVIRALMFEAAATVEIDPDRLSFTGCFQILQCRLPECDACSPVSLIAWYEGVLWEMSQERTDPRRNRINPRVIKQKVSKWPKKQAQHFKPPPLTKTFQESVVMLI